MWPALKIPCCGTLQTYEFRVHSLALLRVLARTSTAQNIARFRSKKINDQERYWRVRHAVLRKVHGDDAIGTPLQWGSISNYQLHHFLSFLLTEWWPLGPWVMTSLVNAHKGVLLGQGTFKWGVRLKAAKIRSYSTPDFVPACNISPSVYASWSQWACRLQYSKSGWAF